MQKLFVAFDASPSAWRALQYAIKLAKEQGRIQLHIANVHPEPVIYGEIQVYASREKIEEEQRTYSLDILKPVIEEASRAQVSFESEVLIGHTALTIVSRAEELQCTGIIMGTRGMGAIANLVLGSVATKVIHLTKLPVTLVK
jgi:nucleotide-binding universal stress UspA family protein